MYKDHSLYFHFFLEIVIFYLSFELIISKYNSLINNSLIIRLLLYVLCVI